ncbi:hypothetical protein [Streptomyces sp. NPDC018833]|uniref:hypothetical protein n=1 Tax=Streptomyces sp. NPDC018833 TaxID=3365053 RepID=UPI0037A13488
MSHWQAARALAYLKALSVGTADPELVQDLNVIPGPESAADPGVDALLERLGRQVSTLPLNVLDAVLRDCDILLRGNQYASFAVGAELAAHSQPADTEQAVTRAAVLTTYWYECPELRGGLALVCSANQFLRRWLAWPVRHPEGSFSPNSPGVATSPAPPLPAAEHFPDWAAPLLERACMY